MKVQILVVREGTIIPNYKHIGDAGMDLVNMSDDVILKPFGRTLVYTGLKVAIPLGYELQIRPRSGMALNKGITLLNSPGTIDSGYRGEIGVIIYNSNNHEVLISHGERIAQAVLKKFEEIEWVEVNNLDDTLRGDAGFGSTGTH